MDTCYSGISRDEKTLLASARPLRLLTDESEGDMPSNFTVFSASQISQMSSGLKEAKHGIFSYYLMKGLEGKADSNKDNKIIPCGIEARKLLIDKISDNKVKCKREGKDQYKRTLAECFVNNLSLSLSLIHI